MPCRQLRQLWQATLGETTTRVPTSAPEAAAPASTTVPTISWPSTTPVVAGWPGGFSTMCRSVPQTPQASTSTSTSLGEPRTGRARRWTSTLSGPANTTARIVPAADRSLLMALPSFVRGAPGPYHDLTRRWRPPAELREGRRRRWPDGRPCRRPALRPGRRATHE